MSSVRFSRDSAYIREHYLQWLVFRSRLERWLLLLGPLLIVLGIWVLIAEPEKGKAKFSALILIALGVWQFVAPYFQFKKWKKKLLDSNASLPDLLLFLEGDVLTFDCDDMTSERMPLGKHARVWKGSFFYIGPSGKHIYLPDRWANREDAQQLLRISKERAGRVDD